MKKIFYSLIITIFLVENAFAASGDVIADDFFYVKGYKINPDSGIEFVIVDAINDSLDTIVPPDTLGDTINQPIILTNHLGDYLQTLSTPEEIIFAFRLASQDAGRFDIEFSFTPFTQQNASQGESPFTIDAAYTIDNLNFVFSETIPENSSYSGVYIEDLSQGISANDINKTVRFSDGLAEPSDGKIKQPLKVISDGTHSWIFRGAIKMAISSTDFQNAPYGTYQSTVTARLTVEE